MNDRQLLQQALEGLEKWRWGNDPRGADGYIAALNERLAHCDRCGKRLGGEGDIHTCTPKPEQEPVAEVKLKTTGGNVGIATVIHEIYSHYREPLRPGDKLYATPPSAQHQCKWPTCQSEEYQQALAEQINQELVTGAAQQELAQDMMRDALTIGSAWVRDGKRLEPTSVYKSMEEDT